MQPSDAGLARIDDFIFQTGGETQGAFQDNSVGTDGREYVIHQRKRVDHALLIDRSGQIEENEIVFPFFHQCSTRLRGFLGEASDHRIHLLVQPCELLVGHRFVTVVFRSHAKIAIAHLGNAVLRIIAIHDRYVVPFHVVQIRSDQHRKRRFSGSSFLGGECHAQIFLFHRSINLSVIHKVDRFYVCSVGHASSRPIGRTCDYPVGCLTV